MTAPAASSVWSHVAHVDPPPLAQEVTDGPEGPGTIVFERSLIYYLGPNLYPAGLYLPQGYDLEERPGDEEGWKIIRARDSLSNQILTLWAVRTDETEGDRVRILDP
jgi:hypothetical protein